jgi:hypothetical protein
MRLFASEGGMLPYPGQVVRRNMVRKQGRVTVLYNVAYGDGFIDLDISETQLEKQRTSWLQGTRDTFIAWVRDLCWLGPYRSGASFFCVRPELWRVGWHGSGCDLRSVLRSGVSWYGGRG